MSLEKKLLQRETMTVFNGDRLRLWCEGGEGGEGGS